MGIMSDPTEKTVKVHGFYWPRYLFQDEIQPSNSSILQRRPMAIKKDTKRVSPSKLLPTKAKKLSPKQQRETERIVRSVADQLSDIGGSKIMPSTLATVALPNQTQSPLTKPIEVLPSLVSEHSYCWNRTTLNGKPVIMPNKQWSRMVPSKPIRKHRSMKETATKQRRAKHATRC